MSSFRVTVCLTRYYNDERSYCYMCIDDKFKTISDLEAYLRKQFRLKNNLCLMIDNNLLLSEETTTIIKEGEIVTVIPVQEDWWKENKSDSTETIDVVDSVGTEKNSKKKKKKKSKPDANNGNDDEIDPIKKEKNQSENSDTESTKKIDADMDVSMGSESQQDIEPKLDEESDNEENSQNADDKNQGTKITDMQTAIQQLKQKALSLLGEVATQKQVTGVSGGRINKRKRIRKRNKNSLSVSTPDLTETDTPPVAFKPVTKAASHIRFDNDSSQNTVRNSEIQLKPRIVHAVEASQAINSRRNSLGGSSSCSNNVAALSDEISKENQNNNKATRKEPTITVEQIKKRLSEFPVMDNVYPVVTDLIMFKMLKLGNNYTPVVSNEILGTVLEVNKFTDNVKVLIVDGHEEWQPVKGKFDLEESTDNCDDELIVDVIWSQVAEPRVIFP